MYSCEGTIVIRCDYLQMVYCVSVVCSRLCQCNVCTCAYGHMYKVGNGLKRECCACVVDCITVKLISEQFEINHKMTANVWAITRYDTTRKH